MGTHSRKLLLVISVTRCNSRKNLSKISVHSVPTVERLYSGSAKSQTATDIKSVTSASSQSVQLVSILQLSIKKWLKKKILVHLS